MKRITAALLALVFFLIRESGLEKKAYPPGVRAPVKAEKLPAASEARDLRDHLILGQYFSPFGPKAVFPDGSVVYDAWGDADGNNDLDRHLVWVRDGEVFRDHAYRWDDPLGDAFILPRDDGTCGVLAAESEGIAVYEWTDDGMEAVKNIPGPWMAGDIRTVDGGFFAYDGNAGTLSCFDSRGEPLSQIPMAGRIPASDILGETRRGEIAGAVGRMDGLCAVVFRTEIRNARHSRYLAVCLDRREEAWSRSFQFDPALAFPGDGSLFRLERSGSGAVPVKIVRLDGAGKDGPARTLSSDGLVLRFSLAVSPATGRLTLFGSAVADSRRIYTVFRMELDDELKQVSLDVRELDYYREYNPVVIMSGGGSLFVHCNGTAPAVGTALIPFDELSPCDAHGIGIR